jgi:signal transduction histidine kinase
MLLRTVIFVVSLWAHGFCPAQTGSRFSIKQYTTEEGLPSNGIKGLHWDAQTGFLWVGTEAGIARFNGTGFKVFSKENTPGLNPDRISHMAEDSAGSIFALTQNAQVFAIVQNRVLAEQPDGVRQSHRPQGITEQQAKLVQQTARNQGYQLLGPIYTIAPNEFVSLDTAKALHWMAPGTQPYHQSLLPWAKGIFSIDGVFFALGPANDIRLLKKNMAQDKALSIFDEAGHLLPLPKSARFIWQYGMQSPVMFLDESAWLLSYTNGQIKGKRISPQLPLLSLLRYAQYDEKSKTLFIGTESKGIIVVTAKRVLPIKNNTAGINERTAYYSQVGLDANNVLTNEGHVVGLGKQPAVLPIAGKFSLRTSLTPDSLLWYTQPEGKNKNLLFCYDPKTGATRSYRNEKALVSTSVAIFNGQWIVATTDGFAITNGDSLRYIYRYPEKQPTSNEPHNLTPVSGNVFVYATCNALLAFDAQRLKVDTLFQLKDYCIRTLKKHGDYFLLGTYGGGYYIYRNGVCRQMPLDKNRFLLYTHCFFPDQQGFCWMSTNRGLFKAKMDDMLQAFERQAGQVYYHYLGRGDGMDITEMNGGCTPCALQLNPQQLSFPTMDGLLWVTPATDNLPLPQGEVWVDYFWANNHLVTDTANLHSNTREIQVGIDLPTWCNSENIYIDYRLGNEKEWQPLEIKGELSIKLNNLPPGSYQLQIRKLNGFGLGNYSYKTIAFTIATPWHQQGWFYLLLGTLAAGLLLLVYRLRTRQLRRKQLRLEKQVAEKTSELQEKNSALEKNNSINARLISIISHIVTPLKFLNAAGKNLLEKKTLMPEDLKDETIREITNTSKELQLLSTNILNWIKYQNENRRLVKEHFSLHELVNQSLSVLQSLARQKHLALHNQTDSELMLWQYHEPLKILVYNLVANAINFSDKGSIVIGNRQQNGSITIAVSDEGVGMGQDQIDNIMNEQFIISSANRDNRKGNGLGYLIIKDLLKTMGGSMEINSAVGKGTTVSVTLPMGNTP